MHADPSGVGDADDTEHEADYRFTLANERTFLAWVRTSLALIAGGVAVRQVDATFGQNGAGLALAVVTIALGSILTALSLRRWRRNDRAMRTDQPLPLTSAPFVLTVGIVAIAVLALVLVV